MFRHLTSLIAVALLSVTAAAQLSGTYTVDNTTPTGGTNFNTLQEASNALQASGVSGPVIMAVINTSLDYSGFTIVNPIPGTSAASTVLFAGLGMPVISGTAAGFVQCVRLGAASISSGTGPSFVEFDGLIMTSGNTTGAAFIATRCDNIVVRNCVAHTSGSGIYFGATTNSTVEDCEVYGIANNPGTPGSATYTGGITLYYTANDCTIQRNRVHDCTHNGIFVGTSGNTTQPLNPVVINNMVWDVGATTSTYPGGIALRRCFGAIISNNSVRMGPSAVIPGLHIMVAAAGTIEAAEVSNNLIRHEGSSACIRLEGTTTGLPAILDYNLYDAAGAGPLGLVASTPYANLAAWQAVAAPNLAGKELNSIEGPAGFTGPADLTITPASLAFNAGSTVAAVTVDIFGTPRPLGIAPDIGAHETPDSGLFASFTANITSGPAPLTVSFTDQTFTSDPGGVLTWAWDIDNDGIDDYFVQNPMHAYNCPGVYSVKLTVTDSMHPSDSYIRTGYITVGPYQFGMATSGGGVGDLTVTPVTSSCTPTAVRGYTLISVSGSGSTGSGPFFGLYPDQATITGILTAPAPGNLLNFIVAGGMYPNGGNVVFPPGFFAPLTGASLDAVEILLDANSGIVLISNVARVTF